MLAFFFYFPIFINKPVLICGHNPYLSKYFKKIVKEFNYELAFGQHSGVIDKSKDCWKEDKDMDFP